MDKPNYIKIAFNNDVRCFKNGNSLEIPVFDNDITFVFGSNGCGKSTAMHIIRANRNDMQKMTMDERCGMQNNDDIIFKSNALVSICGLERYDHVFMLDSVDDNPLSFLNSATASSMICGGGLNALNSSNGQKSLSMLSRFIHKIEKITNRTASDAKNNVPYDEKNLIIFDEIDDGFDILWQKQFTKIMKGICKGFNGDIICITHNPMLPLFANGNNTMVYSISTNSQDQLQP